MKREIIDKAGHKHYIPDIWDENRTRCSYSNGKTGLPSVNLLAGSKDHLYDGCIPDVLKEYFPLVTGTCPCDCPGCYAKKITRNIEPFIKLALNTIEAMQDPHRFWALVEKELYGDEIILYKVIRIHDSGEFFSFEYFKECMNFIERHKESRFGDYSKAKDIINEYGIENLPDNLVMSCSPWEGHCEPIGDLPQFIYDNHTNPELASLPHCPAVSYDGKRTGVQCKQCLHCYKAKHGDRWAVYAH